MSPQNIRILEPHIVLTDILKTKKPGRKRKNNIKHVVYTTRRTRSSGLLVDDNKEDIPKSLMPCKPAKTKVAGPRKRAKSGGRPLRVKKDRVVHAILRRKDDIVQADGQLVPSSNPAWVRIKKELDNKIAVVTLHRIAERDMYKLLIGEQESIDVPDCATSAEPADVKKPEAHYHDNNSALEESTRVHDNNAALEEANRLHDNSTLLQEPNRDYDDPTMPVEQHNCDRDRDNTTVYERLLLNLVETIDCLNKEIKELTNELRQRNYLTQKRNSAC